MAERLHTSQRTRLATQKALKNAGVEWERNEVLTASVRTYLNPKGLDELTESRERLLQLFRARGARPDEESSPYEKTQELDITNLDVGAKEVVTQLLTGIPQKDIQAQLTGSTKHESWILEISGKTFPNTAHHARHAAYRRIITMQPYILVDVPLLHGSPNLQQPRRIQLLSREIDQRIR